MAMMEDIMTDFGSWLRCEIKRRGMLYMDFAENAQIAKSTLSYLMKGRKMPTVATFFQILNALDMHIEVIDN